jgi:RNA polymerase sigma-70 factor (ECF subfamily)
MSPAQRDREFEASLDAIHPALVRAGRVLCWSDADVDDVVQETLLAAYRGRASFKSDASPFTWCYTILTRVASRANRRHARGRSMSMSLPLTHEDAELAESLDAPLPAVDRRLMDDETSRAVVDAIRTLPQRQREVITLHFLQDCSYAAIASALGISVGTVKATVFAAKQSLREKLSGEAAAATELRR